MNRTSPASTSAQIAIVLVVLALGSLAHAQSPVAVADFYTVPSGILHLVEAPGVMENDHDGGGEPPPPPTAVAQLASEVSHGVLFLNGDGSFEYTSNTGFVGDDTFTYYFVDGALTSNTATVTISVEGCEAGISPTQWLCWVEQAYLAKAAELGLSTFVEGAEDDIVWAAARAPATAPEITSQGVTWTSNFAPNDISTGPGPARSGDWGLYSLPHGDQTGPFGTFIRDGFVATGPGPDSLLGVGGWLVASQLGSRIEFVIGYDGGSSTTVNFPDELLDVVHKFYGFIDTNGFTSAEIVETEGTVGQPLLIFGDDFSIVIPGTDTTPPRVVEIGSWEETSDGVISEGEITDVAISELIVRFSESVLDPPGDSDPDDVTNPANYLLFDDGGDGFDTVDCAGGIDPGDNPIPVAVWEYLSGEPSQTSLTVNNGVALPIGRYRLLVCGTTSIFDWAGNILDGDGDGTGGDDFVRNFEVAAAAVSVISISDAAVVEGDVGTTPATFTLSIAPASASEVRVDYATAQGSATAGIDYLSISGTAVFPPQTLTQEIQVPVVGDLEPEIDETYSVELTAPVNATIADSSGVGTIIDDDPWNWYVATDGDDLNDCQSPATACLTITEAVWRAGSGDVVNIAGGTYGDHLYLGTDLTLVGEPPAASVIDGGGTGIVIEVAPAATVAMSGLEIRNGGLGGIVNHGDLNVLKSWVHHNGDGSPSSFGGLSNLGTAFINRVSVTDNNGDTADGLTNHGQLTILNSTVADNILGGGPGIDNLSGATLELAYSTVAGNGDIGIGVGDIGSTSMRGTIVAGHATANCDGDVATAGHNLEDGDDCGLQPAVGDLVNADPLLGPLGDHGGPSPTMLPDDWSPVVDSAETSGAPAADQRGIARPIDGDGDGSAVADIGAVEVASPLIFRDGFESGDTSAWSL
jgi:hypothetical protein